MLVQNNIIFLLLLAIFAIAIYYHRFDIKKFLQPEIAYTKKTALCQSVLAAI